MKCVRRRDITLLASTFLVCLLSPGCGDGTPSVDTSRTEAKVSGTVRVRGQLAEGGTIIFNPSNHQRIVPTFSATINKDGTYSVTTYTGGNQILFDGDVALKNREIGLLREYVEVQRGENTANFDLLSEGSKKSPFPIPKKGTAKEGTKR
jgi:hypothetical protein